ncbi:unnamed protein product [marine sediment metagenome]|uniref:Uncharacterized protein n=1 Tax=marine sediment metagenome TaxID=412755 RepID=X0X3T1_9ZZZZ
MRNEIKKLFKEKELFHKDLAKLSFEQKIKMLVRLQEIANDMKSVVGKKKRTVWKV